MAVQLLTDMILPVSVLSAGDYEPMVSYDLWTSIFTLCNLIILFLVAKKFLFKPVKKMIDSRQQEIDDMYENAEKSSKEAEELKIEYEERLRNAQEESEDIMRRATRNAKLKEEEILKNAREEASATMRRASEQIELEKRAAINEIKNDVSNIAIDIAQEVLKRDINQSEHSAMIDSFIDKLGDEK